MSICAYKLLKNKNHENRLHLSENDTTIVPIENSLLPVNTRFRQGCRG